MLDGFFVDDFKLEKLSISFNDSLGVKEENCFSGVNFIEDCVELGNIGIDGCFMFDIGLIDDFCVFKEELV